MARHFAPWAALTGLTERREAERRLRELDQVNSTHEAEMTRSEDLNHELRTPLNAVLGFAQLLRHDLGRTDVERQRAYVEAVERAGWELLEQIERLLGRRDRESS